MSLSDRRRYLALACLLLLGIANRVTASDILKEPPSREAFLSAGGCFEFVVTMKGESKEWATSGSSGSLFRTGGKDAGQLWEVDLPQAYRPRFAVVNDDGYVVLLDQWINVIGPHAVTVLGPDGRTIASHGFNDVANAVGIAGRDIVPKAKHGAWMAALPEADIASNAVRVAVGDRQLVIRFETGALSTEAGEAH